RRVAGDFFSARLLLDGLHRRRSPRRHVRTIRPRTNLHRPRASAGQSPGCACERAAVRHRQADGELAISTQQSALSFFLKSRTPKARDPYSRDQSGGPGGRRFRFSSITRDHPITAITRCWTKLAPLSILWSTPNRNALHLPKISLGKMP